MLQSVVWYQGSTKSTQKVGLIFLFAILLCLGRFQYAVLLNEAHAEKAVLFVE